MIGASLLALLLAAAACGSDAPARRPSVAGAATDDGPAARARPGAHAIGLGNEKDQDVHLQFDRGYLSDNDVNDAMEKHQRTLVDCYQRAGEQRKYVSGQVVLRFLVSKTGQVSDVLVVGSTLGHYAVERCLVAEGRRIPFPPPGGNNDTEFEYSLKFRSSGEIQVVEWGQELMAKDIGALSPGLGGCGPLGPREVRAVAYIEPGGSVASVGLSCDGPLDGTVGICVIEQIRRWHLPNDRDHVVRTSFPLLAMAAPVPAAVERRKPAKRSRR